MTFGDRLHTRGRPRVGPANYRRRQADTAIHRSSVASCNSDPGHLGQVRDLSTAISRGAGCGTKWGRREWSWRLVRVALLLWVLTEARRDASRQSHNPDCGLGGMSVDHWRPQCEGHLGRRRPAGLGGRARYGRRSRGRIGTWPGRCYRCCRVSPARGGGRVRSHRPLSEEVAAGLVPAA